MFSQGIERSVEILVFINVILVGVSHVMVPDVWVQFFKTLREQGKAGALANGFLSLTFGTIIVSFHWVWEGAIPISVTCLGIAQVIKSFIYFTFPAVGLRSMSSPNASMESSYRIGGAVFLVYGALLAWHLWYS